MNNTVDEKVDEKYEKSHSVDPTLFSLQHGIHTLDSTVVILDWDDTLLPSSWITQSGYRLDSVLDLDDTVGLA